jgi:hypothetical protein
MFNFLSGHNENLEHTWAVIFHGTYITKQQGFNSGFRWSIYKDLRWPGADAFTTNSIT